MNTTLYISQSNNKKNIRNTNNIDDNISNINNNINLNTKQSLSL